MSDAPTPPLRMKPRLAASSDQDAPPASSQPPPGPTKDVASPLKLRPPAPVTPPPIPVVSSPAPGPSREANLPPPATAGAEQPASKPLLPLAPPPAVIPSPPPGPKKVAIHIRAPKVHSDDSLLSGKPQRPAVPPANQKRTTTRRVGGAVLVLVLIAGAFTAYRLFVVPAAAPSGKSSGNTKPGEVATPGGAPATPSDTLNGIAAAPGNAIAQAQAAVDAAQRAADQPSLDAVGGRPRSPPRAAPSVTTEVSLAPGITMAVPEEREGAASASGAFRSFVAEAKIGGVRAAANPPSALINNRLVRVGQPVDNGLGLTIIFSASNAETRELTFTDRSSGASVVRRY